MLNNIITNLQNDQRLLVAGKNIEEATAAMILLHGRGGTASGILQLANVLFHPEMIYIAPQALNNSWYPFSFLAPLSQNEPYLSQGLKVVFDLIKRFESTSITPERIIIAGFSQGACLGCEFVARNPRRYGGLLVFSGGVVGPPGIKHDYRGSLNGMPAFIGCSDKDAHIPLERVHETAMIFTELGADITKKIYPAMGHTINQDEITHAQNIIDRVSTT